MTEILVPGFLQEICFSHIFLPNTSIQFTVVLGNLGIHKRGSYFLTLESVFDIPIFRNSEILTFYLEFS